MNTISDDDLILLYYGEHEDPTLARRVADDTELSHRFRRLTSELGALEHWTAPRREDAYGAEVWHRLVPQLATDGRPAAGPGLLSRLMGIKVPLAGVLSLALVAALAFMLGRETTPVPEQLVSNGVQRPAPAINTERLLQRRVGGHLDDLDVLLTQVANGAGSNGAEPNPDWAMEMLVANRLYRQSAEKAGNQRLAALLDELEPLLLELAHQTYRHSDATRDRIRKEVQDNLLFKVRVAGGELNPKTI